MLFVSLTRYKTERFVRWHYTSRHGPQHSATVRKKWCESTSRFCKLGILLKHSHTSRTRFYRIQRLAAGNFPKKPPDSLAKHSHPKLGRLISPHGSHPPSEESLDQHQEFATLPRRRADEDPLLILNLIVKEYPGSVRESNLQIEFRRGSPIKMSDYLTEDVWHICPSKLNNH
jgi:hypothetical protein